MISRVLTQYVKFHGRIHIRAATGTTFITITWIWVYLHSTGTIRPAWDVNNTKYWSTTLDAGFYDIRIALDESAGTVTLAIDDVAGWSSPLQISQPRSGHLWSTGR